MWPRSKICRFSTLIKEHGEASALSGSVKLSNNGRWRLKMRLLSLEGEIRKRGRSLLHSITAKRVMESVLHGATAFLLWAHHNPEERSEPECCRHCRGDAW